MNFLSKFFIKLFTLYALLLVFGCAQKPAKIVNRSKVLYSKNNQFNRDKYQYLAKKNSAKINNEDNKIASNNQNSSSSNIQNLKNDNNIDEDKKNNSQEKLIKNVENQQNIKNSKEFVGKEIIITENAETVYTLAKKHQISTREIIDNNKLKAPYRLHKGDRILIPQSQFHTVKKGETLFSISRIYSMKIDELISINNLSKPYSVKTGTKLQIANYAKNSPSNNENLNANLTDKNGVKKLNEKNVKNNDVKIAMQSNNQNETPEIQSSNLNNQKINENAEKLTPKDQENTSQIKDSSKQNNANASMAITGTIEDKKNIFSWPVRGSVVSKFGPKKGGLYNDGINIKAKEGSSVGSAEDGIVAYAGNELKGYGNLIIIKHAGGWITAYAHLKDLNVTRGQKILKSQKIGVVGSTGSVTFPQLYFGLRKGREALNPQEYLKSMN